MSVLMTMRIPAQGERLEKLAADDPEQLTKVLEHADGHGLIAHQFWGSDGQVMVVDEWETQEDFERFMAAEDGEIKEIMGAVGVTAEPEITYWHKLQTSDEYGRGIGTPMGATTTAGLVGGTFEKPHETRPFEEGKGRMDLLEMAGGIVGRGTFEPGWRWSSHVKPIAGTDSCQAAHMGYLVSGRMTVRMDDGQEQSFQAGDLMIASPGHDAWVDGDEPCVIIDWQGVADYAKR